MGDFWTEGMPIGPSPEPPVQKPPLAAEPVDDPATRQREDLLAFIGANNTGSFFNTRGFARICWPGVLIPHVWFLYRKLYIVAAILCVAPILAATVFRLPYSVTLLNVAAVGIGVCGKAIYLAYAKSAIRRIRADTSDDDEARQRVCRAGGGSKSGAALGIVYTLGALANAISGAAHGHF